MISVGTLLKEYLDKNKISQSEFAAMYNLSKKHVNEIINGKTGISLETLMLISLVTNNDIRVLMHFNEHKKCEDEMKQLFNNEKEIKEYFNKYNLKEMVDRNWIKVRHIEDNVTTFIDLKKFFKTNNMNNYFKYVKENYYFKEAGEKDLIKTCEWINYCNEKINKINVNSYTPDNNRSLLKELELERCKKFNKNNLIELFNKYGIILFIEETLKGSKVRACTHVKVDTPVIYMSTYLKNKHSFYFALYHELSHIMSDYSKLKNQTIIQDTDIELDADRKALEMMIPSSIYKELINNPNNIEKICEDNNIPPSFYYSRLAYKKKIKYSSKLYLDSIEKIFE